MKILIEHGTPFALAHGGFQIQIEQTKLALESIGIEVEFVRWWDDRQKGDLFHYFGGVSSSILQMAKAAGKPVVLTTLFTSTCNRSDARLARQAWLTRMILSFPFGEIFKQQMSWRTYGQCARNVVGLECERHVLQKVYRVPAHQVSVVPLGLSAAYLGAKAAPRNEPHLICTGTITARKNCIELAEMAHAAKTPILFVGKPYQPTDPYWQRFRPLIDNHWVKHHPHVDSEAEMITLLQSSRGFVLMSNYENWCLSAHEAVACGLPLLVQDQKWSRERFGNQCHYFTSIGNTARNVEILKKFYADAPQLTTPAIKLHSWEDVARQLRSIYEEVLNTSR